MITVIEKHPEVIIDKPSILTNENIIYWSPTLKRLEGVKEGNAIRTKALKLLRLNKIEYDKINKLFIVKHIEKYNKTDYKIKGEGKHFTCECQFYNKVSKNWEHPNCSHIQSVKMWLEIKRYNGISDSSES